MWHTMTRLCHCVHWWHAVWGWSTRLMWQLHTTNRHQQATHQVLYGRWLHVSYSRSDDWWCLGIGLCWFLPLTISRHTDWHLCMTYSCALWIGSWVVSVCLWRLMSETECGSVRRQQLVSHVEHPPVLLRLSVTSDAMQKVHEWIL